MESLARDGRFLVADAKTAEVVEPSDRASGVTCSGGACGCLAGCSSSGSSGGTRALTAGISTWPRCRAPGSCRAGPDAGQSSAACPGDFSARRAHARPATRPARPSVASSYKAIRDSSVARFTDNLHTSAIRQGFVATRLSARTGRPRSLRE